MKHKWEKGYFCAVAVYLRENCAKGHSDTSARSLFHAGGDPGKADECDIATFIKHGLMPEPDERKKK